MHIDPYIVLGNSKSAQDHVETVLGVALLVGASAMALRFVLDRHTGWVLCATLLFVAVLWLVFERPWQARAGAVEELTR